MTLRLLRPPNPNETRTAQELRDHYVVEKELALKLRNASRAERGKLYAGAYDELFQRVPHHPQLRNKVSPEQRARQIELQMRMLEPWLTRQTTFLEIGAGDCALSLAVAPKVAWVYALDVSSAITQGAAMPNFTLVLSNGTSIPVPDASITVAYSNQLMEHLHPEDALDQLSNIHRALAPGGTYICITPNRMTGPHDISQYFDTVASGFHLKEYTCGELTSMFHRVGFKIVRQCLRRRDRYLRVPVPMVQAVESTIERLPVSMRARAATARLVRGLLEIRLIARK